MAPVKKVRKMAAVDLGALLDAGDGAVVTLVAGDTRLAAHRAVLAARSPVFEAMFRHDTVEASSREVAIADVEGPVLRQLLAYMYTLQAPQEPSSLAQLLSAADKYVLSGLKAECERRLATELTVESAAAAAVLAVRHTCPTLRQAAVDFIKTHSVHVMGTVGWADAVRNQPEDFIEVNRLLAEPPAEIRSLPVAEKGRRLIEAAKEGTMELRTLLAAGADVNARGKGEGTALHWAAASGHVDAARCLVNSGADVDARCTEQLTPLHLAVWKGHTAMVQLLAQYSVDCNAKNCTGNTPLHWAADRGHVDAARCLVDSGADVDARCIGQNTPLHLAAAVGHTAVVQLLAQYSADCNAQNFTGNTPLHWAADRGHVDAARCLVDSGADVDARSADQETPLHLAAWEGHTAIVQLLVESSADCNAKNYRGSTPLHRAAFMGHGDVAAALLDVGADKEARDDDGKTPLMLATEDNDLEVIEILN